MTEQKIDPWKDYTDRANNFSDWFTAVVISNFAYLIQLVNKEGELASLLESKTYLWGWGFKLSCAALACVFAVKLLGVLAASRRIHKGPNDKCQDWMERIRFWIIIAFFILGITSLVFSGKILHYQFIYQI